MFPFHWLTTLQQQYRSRFRQSARIRQHRNRHARTPCIARATPRHAVESLEDRMLLTAFTVVNTSDSGEGSLRAAIEQANASEGADTISFDAALAGQTILLNNQLRIRDDLTIIGLGADQLTIDANHNSRIFDVYDGDKNTTITVAIRGLTLTNGFAEQGAAILNYETLSLSDSIVSENAATSVGGGIYHAGTVLTITDSVFAENTAAYGGGIYNATQDLIISGSTFFRNTATQKGGGIYTLQGVSRYAAHLPQTVLYYSAIRSLDYQYNLVTITDTTFIENSATQGGALYSSYTNRPVYYLGWCGNTSISASVLSQAYQSVNTDRSHSEFTIANSTFTGNTAVDGGGIYNDHGNITITDSKISANTASNGAGVYQRYSVITIYNSSISENVAQQAGGGILVRAGLTVENSSITNNKAGYGAGIYSSGNLKINGSTLAHNSASYYGGGIYDYYSNLRLSNSTISNNHAGIKGGGFYYATDSDFFVPGPSISVDPIIAVELFADTSPILTEPANDTTLSQDPETTDNLLTSDLSLSMVDLTALAILPDQNDDYCLLPASIFSVSNLNLLYIFSITNCTVTGNSAGQSGGGVWFDAASIYLTPKLNNNIIAGNVAAASPQIKGDYSGGFNIIQDSIEGLLDPVLRDNGGPTRTHALLPGSAAIDAGSNQAASEAGLTTDQRGEGSQRIKEGTVDIGAFEVQAPFTQVDFRFANSNSRKLNNGEKGQLPENRVWLDEAGNYWVEIWLHTPASTTPGIQSASFDLNYNTVAATAVSIEYGAAFAQNQSGTINQNTGTIENLSAETSRTDVGDDQYTLFARIQFQANITESTDGERGRHHRTSAANPEIKVNQLDIRLTGDAASEGIVNPSPGDPVWVNPEPASDIPAFNDLVQGNLQFDYYVQPDDMLAAAILPSNHEFAYSSQLTLIDLPGSPVRVQDESGAEIISERDPLVGNRHETEEDLPKNATSGDHDFSAADAFDQFFMEFPAESVLTSF